MQESVVGNGTAPSDEVSYPDTLEAIGPVMFMIS